MYDLAKMGPPRANTCPIHVVFVKSQAAKERLKPALVPGNVDKTMAAPVFAIVANDMQFFRLIPRLFPQSRNLLISSRLLARKNLLASTPYEMDLFKVPT